MGRSSGRYGQSIPSRKKRLGRPWCNGKELVGMKSTKGPVAAAMSCGDWLKSSPLEVNNGCDVRGDEKGRLESP